MNWRRYLLYITHHSLHRKDKRVAKIAFTGSGPTGRRVAAAAAENLRPASLELGEKYISGIIDIIATW